MNVVRTFVSRETSAPVTDRRLHVELPFHSKFLLIAAYLASYNPVIIFVCTGTERLIMNTVHLIFKDHIRPIMYPHTTMNYTPLPLP